MVSGPLFLTKGGGGGIRGYASAARTLHFYFILCLFFFPFEGKACYTLNMENNTHSKKESFIESLGWLVDSDEGYGLSDRERSNIKFVLKSMLFMTLVFLIPAIMYIQRGDVMTGIGVIVLTSLVTLMTGLSMLHSR